MIDKEQVLKIAGEPVHQWSRSGADGWIDVPKDEAYDLVDEYYEARTLYTEAQVLAAYAKGAEDMRERAAKKLERVSGRFGRKAGICALFIRALPINTEGEN